MTQVTDIGQVPLPISNSELITPGCEIWSMGNSLGETCDYICFHPENDFLTEVPSAMFQADHCSCSELWRQRWEFEWIKWLQYAEQGSREEWGEQGQGFQKSVWGDVLVRIGLHINRTRYYTRLITEQLFYGSEQNKNARGRSMYKACWHTTGIHKPY